MDDLTHPNSPCTVSVNALLMQNYTVPSEQVKGWKLLAACLQPSSSAISQNDAPKQHIFGSDGNNRVFHLKRSRKSLTGWVKTDLSMIAGLFVQLLDCSVDQTDGAVVCYVITRDGRNTKGVYSRKIDPRVTEWTYLNPFPATSTTQSINSGVLNGQTVLMTASEEGYPASMIKSIRLNGAQHDWIQFTNPEKGFYNVAVGQSFINGQIMEGVYGARSLHTRTFYDVAFYSSNGGDPIELYCGTDNDPYTSIIPSPRFTTNKEIFALTKAGYLYRLTTSASRDQIFSGWGALLAFTVVQPNVSVEFQSNNNNSNIEISDNSIQVFAVTKTNQLIHSTFNQTTNTWGNAVTYMKDIIAIQSVTLNGFVNIFVLNNLGALFELIREPLTSEWRRLPVYVEIPPKSNAMTVNINSISIASNDTVAMGESEPHQICIQTSGNRIFHYRDSPSTPVGVWISEEFTKPPNEVVKQVITAQDYDGSLVFFSVMNSRKVYYRRIYDDRWIACGTFPNNSLNFTITAGMINGKLELLAYYQLANKASRVARIDYSDTGVWENLTVGYDDINSVSIGYTEIGQGFFASIKDGAQFRIEFFNMKVIEPSRVYCRTDKAYKAVAGTKRGVNEMFVINNANQVEYHTSLGISPSVIVQLFVNQNIRSILPCLNNDGLLEVLAVDSANYVQHCRYSGLFWSDPQKIANNVSNVDVSVNHRDGKVKNYYCNSITGGFYEMNPYLWSSTRTGDVQYVLVEDKTFKTVEFKSYVTEIIVGDKNGVGVAGEPLFFLPLDEFIEVEINGKLHHVYPNDEPITMFTNGSGKVVFTIQTTTLHTPQLQVWTRFMSNDDCIVVQPNGEIQTYLANIDEATLRNAKKQDGNGGSTNLFADPSVVNADFVNTVHEVMSISQQSGDRRRRSAATTGQFIAPRSRNEKRSRLFSQTTRAAAKELLSLDPTMIEDRHFQIEFIPNHGVKFHRHTYESIDEVVHNALNGNVVSASVSSSSPPPSTAIVMPWSGTFGDLFYALNNGIATAESMIFTSKEIGVERGFFSGLKAVVNFIVEGVTYVWQGFIGLVEDAFDCLQSIFAHVKIFFKDLFGWLGSFFSWNDILNTQKFFVQVVNSMFGSIPRLITNSASLFNFFFNPSRRSGGEDSSNEIEEIMQNETFRQVMSTTENNGVNQVNEENQQVGYAGMSGEDEKKQFYGDDPQSNWLENQMNNFMNESDCPIVISEAVQNATAEIGAALEENIKDGAAAIQNSINNAFNLFTTKEGDMKNSEAVESGKGNRSVSSLVESIINSCLSAASTITDGLISLLNMRINIPLITPLFENVICPNSSFTILNLLTLLGAIPATIGWKLMTLVTLGTAYPPVVPKNSDIINAKYQISLETVTSLMIYDVSYWDQSVLAASSVSTKSPQAVSSSSSPSSVSPKASNDLSDLENFSVSVSILTGVLYSQSITFAGICEFFKPESPAHVKYIRVLGDFIGQVVSVPVYPWEAFPTNNSGKIEFGIWVFQFLIVAFEFFDAAYPGRYVDNIGAASLGFFHLAAFGLLCGAEATEFANDNTKTEKEKRIILADLVLKTVQNVFTAFGEIMSAIFGDSEALAKQFRAAYCLLFFEAPGLINLSRCLMNKICQLRHYNL